MSFVTRMTASLILVVAILGIAGCGKSPATLSGKVTYQGKILTGGNVSLISTDNGPSAAGRIAEDGTYKVDNAISGTYKICVETASLKPPQGSLGQGAKKSSSAKGIDPGTALPEGYTPSSPSEAVAYKNLKRYIPIPDSYSKPETTDLSITLAGGNQAFDIELK